MAVHPMLPSAYFESVSTLEGLLLSQQGHDFAAQYPACTFLCQRFDATLSSGSAWLEVVVVRYTFNVWDFHSHHLAGFTGAPKPHENHLR
jgi:hypothetical protein